MAGGLWAAGRSSTDPATARKAEEKKRGQGARIVAQGDTPACNLLRNHDARALHAGLYSRRAKNWQVPAHLFASCTNSALPDGRKTLSDPKLNQILPRHPKPLRLGIQCTQLIDGEIEGNRCQLLARPASRRP